MAKEKKYDYIRYRYMLGQNIARIRKQEIGCSQAEMVEYTGISRAYYGKIEVGTHAATIDMLLKIANAFKLPLYRLFLDENDDPINLSISNPEQL